jgi:uncharacterized protein YukE
MIDSRDAVKDKQDLQNCRATLDDMKNYLIKLRDLMGASWQGEARNQCYDRLDNFIARIDELTGRSDTAVRMLDTIVSTYHEADKATAGMMGGFF